MIILIIVSRSLEGATIAISRKAAITFVAGRGGCLIICVWQCFCFLSLLRYDYGLLLFWPGLL